MAATIRSASPAVTPDPVGSYLPPEIAAKVTDYAVSAESSLSAIVEGIFRAAVFCDKSKLSDEQTRTFIREAVTPLVATKCVGETSVMMHAAFTGNFVAVGTLLTCFEVNLDAKDAKGRTALALAAMKYAGYASSAKAKSYLRIIEVLCQRSEVNTMDYAATTPLHHICWSRDEASAEGIKLLLKYGADVHARNRKKETPCHLLAFRGNIAGLNALKPYKPNLNAISSCRAGVYLRPLDCAAFYGHAKVISWIQKQSDILCLEAFLDNAITVADLRDNGIFDYPAPPGRIKSFLWQFKVVREPSHALRSAAALGYREAVKILLSGPCDGYFKWASLASTKSGGGTNALHTAVLFNQKLIVRDLLKHVDINAKTDNGETALEIAKRLGHKEIFHDLLMAGAKP